MQERAGCALVMDLASNMARDTQGEVNARWAPAKRQVADYEAKLAILGMVSLETPV